MASTTNRPWFLKGGLLIDGNGGAPVSDPVITIEGSRIAAVQHGASVKPPTGARVVDCRGCTLMPGMMDLHLHLASPNSADYQNLDLAMVIRTPAEMLLDAAKNARVLLEAGFTTLRDMDWVTPLGRNFVQEIGALRDAIAAGKLPGPRLIAGAFILTTGSHHDRMQPRVFRRDLERQADGPWEIRRLSRLNLRDGADFLKACVSGGQCSFDRHDDLWDRNITQEELDAMADEAHAYQKPLAAHCHTPISVKMALQAGVDTIEHCTYADDEAVQRLAASGRYNVPTLALREESVIAERRARGAPEYVLTQAKEIADNCFATFERYRAAGVKIAMGTDTCFHPLFGSNARELEIYVSLGLTPMQAIQTATRNAADAIGMLPDLGTVEAGKIADLIAVDGNPLDSIAHLQKIERIKLVVQDGRIAVNRLA
ncbi:MAG: amidohydrolase family protein [Alphaproteobacteria bacterium]|nr:amidohydrolase family protein [Alphaproteobacteria bacterium]